MNLTLGIKFFFMSVIGLCVTLVLIIPFLSPFICVFFLWYLIVKLILKVKYGNAVYKASGTDVTHGRQTDLTVPVINAAVRVHGDLNVDRIKAQMTQMIETSFNNDGQKRYRRLKEIYERELGYNVWRAYENFDINDHVHVIHLVNEDINADDKLAHILEKLNAKNLNYVEMLPLEQELYILNEDSDPSFQTKERTPRICHKSKASWNIVLKSLLNKHGGKPFPVNLPPWSVLVVDEGEQMYTVLFRFHHAIADGIYFSRMFCEDILDESVKVFQSYKPPPKIIRWLTSFWAFCLLPFGILEIISKNDNNPLHGPMLTGKKLYFVSNSLPLERFHVVKKKIKVSLHSIVCSCISFAVSSHFVRRGCDAPSATMLSPLPLQNPHKQIKLKNKFAISSIMLPTPPPEKVVNKKPETSTTLLGQTRSVSSMMRLTQVQATLNEASQSPALLATNTLVTIICSLLPEELTKLLLSVKGCTMAVSNLPGSQVESKLWDGTLVDQIFWVPDRDPMGVGFSILGYNGYLRVGVVIDDALLQDVMEGDIIIEDFENELNNILKELNDEEIDMKVRQSFSTKDESIP